MWTVLSSKYWAPNVLLSSLSDQETAISCLMEQVALCDKLSALLTSELYVKMPFRRNLH